MSEREDKSVTKTDPTRERRVRREADRLGLRLAKSRCRTPGLPGHGCYALQNPARDKTVYGADSEDGSYTLSLDDVDAVLLELEKERWEGQLVPR